MTPDQSSRRTVTLSYGVLAAMLLAALLIGFLSGGLVGSFALPRLAEGPAWPNTAPSGPAHAWLGITYVPITPAVARIRNLAVTKGALVVAVSPNSPAAKAGLRENDIISAVERRAIDETTNVLDVLRDKKPGDRIQVTLLRDGSEQTIEITLGRSPTSSPGMDRNDAIGRLRRTISRLLPGQ